MPKPKLILKIEEKSGKTTRLCPSERRMRKLLNNSLKTEIRNGASVTFRVNYGKGRTAQGKIETFDNEIETNDIEELKWAVEAFLEKGLLVL